MLAVLPGMTFTVSGEVEVFGLGTPVIYINNRKARADELQQLTPQDIRSVELITNPGRTLRRRGESGAEGLYLAP